MSRSDSIADQAGSSLRLDPHRRAVHRGHERVALTTREFALLEALLERNGLPSTKEELAERVWGPSMSTRTDAVDRCVQQLREKLGDIIELVADGYRLRV